MQTSFLLLEHLAIVKTRGSHLKVEAAKFSNLLLKIRREVIAQRKEAERQAQLEAEERAEMIMTVFAVLLLIVAAVSGAGAWLYYKGWIDL